MFTGSPSSFACVYCRSWVIVLSEHDLAFSQQPQGRTLVMMAYVAATRLFFSALQLG
jgi:hypothetical protein